MKNNFPIKINNIIKEMQNGLTPEVIANWYFIVQNRASQLCPKDLRGKIIIEQDPVLPMKFKLNISKRTIPFVIAAIDQSSSEMPYSTKLYFEKVHEIILQEFTKTKTSTR